MADIVKILQNKEAYEAPIDYIIIDGTKFTNYGAFTFMWEKSYVDDESLKRANDGSIPQINDASFFITSHVKIDFSLLSIDDYRALLKLEYEQSEHLVIVYDPLLNEKWVSQYMYIATLEMPKLWTIIENRQKGEENWEHWISVCGVKDYTVELIGTNNPCNIPATYELYIRYSDFGATSQYWRLLYNDNHTTFTYRSFNEVYNELANRVRNGYSIYSIGSSTDIDDSYIDYFRRIKRTQNEPIEYDTYDEISVNPSIYSEDTSTTRYNLAIVDKEGGLIDSIENTAFAKLPLYARVAKQTDIRVIFYATSGEPFVTSYTTNTWISLGDSDEAKAAVNASINFNGDFNTASDGSGTNFWGYEADEYSDYIMFTLQPNSNTSISQYVLNVFSGLQDHKLVLLLSLAVDESDVGIALYAQHT